MTARNDITGDAIASRTTTDAYRDNFDAIFRKTRAMPPAAEPGYTGWAMFPDCTGSCDRGEECRCKP